MRIFPRKPLEHHITFFGSFLVKCNCGWDHRAEELAGDWINELLDNYNAHYASYQQRKETDQ